MELVNLGPTELKVSRLGFGCAQLMGRVGKSQGRRALDLAFDSGVNYFDTARSYGYGECEGLLGEFLVGKRDKVVVATKFGIEVPEMGHLKRAAKTLLRPIFRRAQFLRRAAKGRLGAEFVRGDYGKKHMLASLERSLRELRTDYVDVLHVHDGPPGIWDESATFAALEELVKAGKIRAYGVATDVDSFAAWRGPAHRSFHVAQFPFGLLDQRADRVLLQREDRASVGAVAYRPFGGGGSNKELLRNALVEFAGSSSATPRMREKLANVTPEVVADVAINAVVRSARVDAVLCSMVTPAHVTANVRAASATDFNADELRSMRAFFAARC